MATILEPQPYWGVPLTKFSANPLNTKKSIYIPLVTVFFGITFVVSLFAVIGVQLDMRAIYLTAPFWLLVHCGAILDKANNKHYNPLNELRKTNYELWVETSLTSFIRTELNDEKATILDTYATNPHASLGMEVRTRNGRVKYYIIDQLVGVDPDYNLKNYAENVNEWELREVK